MEIGEEVLTESLASHAWKCSSGTPARLNIGTSENRQAETFPRYDGDARAHVDVYGLGTPPLPPVFHKCSF
jgi:hypothetical protein